jgi:hypothetical protein
MIGRPQIITSPSAEELVVLPRRDYDDLVNTTVARKVEATRRASNHSASVKTMKDREDFRLSRLHHLVIEQGNVPFHSAVFSPQPL